VAGSALAAGTDEELATKDDTDDITIVGICHDHEARVYSHELIARS